jgi:5'-nucleotidase
LTTILVINDDGINSIGLITLAKQLKKLGKVVVVTPRKESSGVGKSICIGHVNVVENILWDGIKVYSTTGTPADSFLLAVNKLLKSIPDLVVSGINIGPNLGIDDLLTSGTVGASFEAAIHNVPSIAISYCLSEIHDDIVNKRSVSVKDLELAAEVGYKTAKYVLERGMPPDVDIISINIPENANSRDIKLTSLCYDGYGDIHSEVKDGYRIKSWALRHYPEGNPGTDLHVIKNDKCISITPIKLEFQHNKKSMKGIMEFLSK